MFCPRCRAEYREGFTVCADCDVPLVPELSPELQPKSPRCVEFEEVLSTFNAGDLSVAESILNSEDIDYYIQNEFFNCAQPLAQPFRVMVRKDQADEAREILKDLKFSYGISGGKLESKDAE